MSSEKIYELAEELEQHARDEGLHKIRAALKGDGTDECIDCGEAIPLARKQAMPNATRCINCQGLSEKK